MKIENIRRIDIEKLVPAELAIRNAMIEVEKLPPDVLLTQAITLLSKAQQKVADLTLIGHRPMIPD